MIETKIIEEVINPILKGEYSFKLKTKFLDLDFILENIDKSSLVVIGSRPSMGKTAFINCIMTNLLEQNHRCLYFSLETNISQVIKRMIAQLAEIDSQRLRSLSLNDNEKNKIITIAKHIEKFDLFLYDDCYDIYSIKLKIEEKKPEYVFIDYLQLFDALVEQPTAQVVENVIKELKNIAKQNNCMIFITSQLSKTIKNRGNKRPILSDLNECRTIVNTADVVMFIHRDDFYKPCKDDSCDKRKADIIIARNKFGVIGTITLLFKSEFAKFYNPINSYEF
ncbi:MAG: DnaB-like helicase C-terminal domain-containing protein [Candidatus Gastranaerophilaceae bacterium]